MASGHCIILVNKLLSLLEKNLSEPAAILVNEGDERGWGKSKWQKMTNKKKVHVQMKIIYEAGSGDIQKEARNHFSLLVISPNLKGN